MVLDIEDEQNSKDSNVITKDINTFEDYVSANGYAKTSTYVMRYWLTIQRVLDAQLHDKNLWVASMVLLSAVIHVKHGNLQVHGIIMVTKLI
ncbi:Putative glycoside hydrolase [Latilactobacillus curvatus]|nr:Putative glycoside hydrolase [Latilactobacillus curvatus]